MILDTHILLETVYLLNLPWGRLGRQNKGEPQYDGGTQNRRDPFGS